MMYSRSFQGCQLMQGGHLMDSEGEGKIPSKTSVNAHFRGLQ